MKTDQRLAAIMEIPNMAHLMAERGRWMPWLTKDRKKMHNCMPNHMSVMLPTGTSRA